MPAGRVRTDPGPGPDWIYLGEPGWWGRWDSVAMRAAEAFLSPLRVRDLIPMGPGEFVNVELVDEVYSEPRPARPRVDEATIREELRAAALAMELASSDKERKRLLAELTDLDRRMRALRERA